MHEINSLSACDDWQVHLVDCKGEGNRHQTWLRAEPSGLELFCIIAHKCFLLLKILSDSYFQIVSGATRALPQASTELFFKYGCFLGKAPLEMLNLALPIRRTGGLHPYQIGPAPIMLSSEGQSAGALPWDVGLSADVANIRPDPPLALEQSCIPSLASGVGIA